MPASIDRQSLSDDLRHARGVLVLLMTAHHASIWFASDIETNVVARILFFIPAAFVFTSIVNRAMFQTKKGPDRDLWFGLKLLFYYCAANLAFLLFNGVANPPAEFLANISKQAAKYDILYVISVFILLPRQFVGTGGDVALWSRCVIALLLVALGIGNPLLALSLGVAVTVLGCGPARVGALLSAAGSRLLTSVGICLALIALGVWVPWAAGDAVKSAGLEPIHNVVYAIYAIAGYLLTVCLGRLIGMCRGAISRFIDLYSKYSLQLYLLQVTCVGFLQYVLPMPGLEPAPYLAALGALLVSQTALVLLIDRVPFLARVDEILFR